MIVIGFVLMIGASIAIALIIIGYLRYEPIAILVGGIGLMTLAVVTGDFIECNNKKHNNLPAEATQEVSDEDTLILNGSKILIETGKDGKVTVKVVK